MLRVLLPCYAGRWRRCLDLGCGTGLSGKAAEPVCSHLVGVDLSPAMVGQARDKRVYHRLLVGDVTDLVLRLAADDKAGLDWCVPAHDEQPGGALPGAIRPNVS